MSWFRRDPGRPLTAGERALAVSLFGAAIDLDRVRIRRARWFPFQPRNVAMAPDGHLWFHPQGGLWRADFSTALDNLQALFVHELTHVWQHQQGLCLLIRRHPFCRYAYHIVPGQAFRDYGIEQQAMIVEHAFTARRANRPDPLLEALLAQASG